MEVDLIKIPTTGNEEFGKLSFFQREDHLPFEIKRVYFTYDVPVGVKRGMHAHKKLKQLIWCPYGEIEIVLNDGINEMKFLLDDPSKGLLLLKGYWRDIYWKKEKSVLCVAASEIYLENDYIRDFGDYIDWINKGGWSNEY